MNNDHHIAFNEPYFPANGESYIKQVINLDFSAADKAKSWLTAYSQAKAVYLTHNCSSAILMGLILADVLPGDEVIVSSFTFVTVADAICLLGAIPVYAEIEGDSMNMCAESVQDCISQKTKAIIFMSYGGSTAGIHEVKKVASENQIMLIEDAAYGFMLSDGSSARPVGTIGDIGCLSFDQTKPYQCLQGGALLLTNDSLRQKAQEVYHYGTNRLAHLRGQISYYQWTSLGFKFQLNSLNSALLLSVFEASLDIRNMLENCFKYYYANLEHSGNCTVTSTFSNQFFIKCQNQEQRHKLQKHLQNNDIDAYSHYEPLHQSKYGKQFATGALKITEEEAVKILRLPFYAGLTEKKQERICQTINEFWKQDNDT